VWALVIFLDHLPLPSTALLASSFGLRHAVDADHIAAIDNVTRKLMQEGRRPVSVGFWFALGHSTVVILLTLAIVITTTELSSHRGSEGRWHYRRHLGFNAVLVSDRGNERLHPRRRLEGVSRLSTNRPAPTR
jgi:high-affinity nickel-transport protein